MKVCLSKTPWRVHFLTEKETPCSLDPALPTKPLRPELQAVGEGKLGRNCKACLQWEGQSGAGDFLASSSVAKQKGDKDILGAFLSWTVRGAGALASLDPTSNKNLL